MLEQKQIDQALRDAHYVIDHEGSLGPLIAPVTHDMAVHVLALVGELRRVQAECAEECLAARTRMEEGEQP